MEQQASQKWATVSGTANDPTLCLHLQPDASSFATLLNVQNPGDTRQNSGDPSLSGAVAGIMVASLLPLATRARAFAATSRTPLHRAR